MSVSRFISSHKRFKGTVTGVCICVSFVIMIVSVSVSNGFRTEIRRGVSALCGDIKLSPVGTGVLSAETDTPVAVDAPFVGEILKIKGVESVSEVIYTPGVIKTSDNITGILFKGVDSTVRALAPMEVCIPSSLSRTASLSVGDAMVAYFVRNGRSVPRKFTVAGIFDSIIDEKDKVFVICRIEDMQRVNGWDATSAGAFEVRLARGYRSAEKIREKEQEIGAVTLGICSSDEYDGPTVWAASCIRMYPEIFDWVNLIDSNVTFILILMMIVSGFNMISGLLIMMFENVQAIGTMKALGMRDRDISRSYRRISAGAVLRAMAAGNLIALGLCLIQKFTRVLTLNPENYFVSSVPVEISPLGIAAIDLISFAVIMVMVSLPLLFIRRVDPSVTMRSK
ncbi:MAG: FtsX-like permease family protein [Bacteroidales bacterium]|nr:FtsX-like permease family protein [Bacteroidales bacterium]